MHGLILAGGEASRIRADGITLPKPLLDVAGRPQILWLVETLRACGCEDITVMMRRVGKEHHSRVESLLSPRGVRLLTCETPSSLHTLVEGLAAVPPGHIFCTMVDTVMRRTDWERVFRETEHDLLNGAADVVLAVTPFVDDEHPLWVGRDAAGRAVSISDEPVSPPCVTGGVYGFGPDARRLAAEALDAGRAKMRSFLRFCVERRLGVATVEVDRIIDLDRRHDLEIASALLAGSTS